MPKTQLEDADHNHFWMIKKKVSVGKVVGYKKEFQNILVEAIGKYLVNLV